MSDRHLHCVYFQYFDKNDLKGHCLLKNQDIEYGFHKCCKNIVLKPREILAYYLKHNNMNNSWGWANETAEEYLKGVGFNNYPKVIK